MSLSLFSGLMRFGCALACRTRGGAILHVPAPPRRSRPWSQGNLAGGASADYRSALYGLLCTSTYRTRQSHPTTPKYKSASSPTLKRQLKEVTILKEETPTKAVLSFLNLLVSSVLFDSPLAASTTNAMELTFAALALRSEARTAAYSLASSVCADVSGSNLGSCSASLISGSTELVDHATPPAASEPVAWYASQRPGTRTSSVWRSGDPNLCLGRVAKASLEAHIFCDSYGPDGTVLGTGSVDGRLADASEEALEVEGERCLWGAPVGIDWPLVGHGRWLGGGEGAARHVALTRGEGDLTPAQANEAARGGAIGVLHLRVDLPRDRMGAAPRQLTRQEAAETALQPVSEWCAIPCVTVGGQHARRLLEWLTRIGPDSLLLRIGPRRAIQPEAATAALRLKVSSQASHRPLAPATRTGPCPPACTCVHSGPFVLGAASMPRWQGLSPMLLQRAATTRRAMGVQRRYFPRVLTTG